VRRPLGSVAKVINGFAFKSGGFNQDAGHPIIRIRDVVRGMTNTRYVGDVPEGYWVEDGDLLVGMDGDFNLGRWKGGRALLNQRVCKIVADPGQLLPEFLFYVLPGYLKLINDHTSSTTVKHLSSRTLQAIEIPVPPLDTQRRIVARIDELFSELGDGEAALARARADLEAYRKSLLKAAVTGELTANWRAANTPAETGEQLLQRILADRKARWEAELKNKGKRYPQPNRPEQEKLFDLPSGWALASVNQIAEVGTGSTPSRKDPSLWNDGQIPWLTSSCVNTTGVRKAEQFVNETAVRAARLRLYPPSTILVALYGEGKTRGKSTVLHIEATINQALAAVQVTQEVVPVDWLRLGFDEGYLRNREISSGGVQPNLNLSKINGLAVPVPPQAEMVEILKIFREAMDGHAAAKSVIEWASSDLLLLRQSILAAAFSGELS